MRPLFLALSFLLQLTSCAQTDTFGIRDIEPVITVTKHKLGDKFIEMKESRFEPTGSIVYVQLHDNEETAEQAAIVLLKEKGGTLLSIENGRKRNIIFSENGKQYEFDPNRIFSKRGINETLDLFGTTSSEAQRTVQSFAEAMLKQLPDSAIIVALHNNTEGRFSILDYNTDKDLKRSVKALYHNNEMDADDFFITTDSALYTRLKERAYSVVLQNNEAASDDGSLSIYFGKKNRLYVNVEAEYGHLDQQTEMLQILYEILKELHP